MVIAWTYLMHAYYRQMGIEYRYYEQGNKRRKFQRTSSGTFRYWELGRCLKNSACPLDEPTKNNRRFMIGLRNEIVHHQSVGVDEAFIGRYVACCLNYDREVTRLFSQRYGVSSYMSYALQLRDLTAPPEEATAPKPLSANVQRFISEFDCELLPENYQHAHFSQKLIFVREVVNTLSQATQSIEFIGADSEQAQDVNKQRWVQKETELSKHLPGNIVELMREEGYSRFNMHHHTQLWKKLDARNKGKGYGVEVCGAWYWYDRWIEQVRKHCADHSESYTATGKKLPAV